ncbi:MAG: hypothetical protein GVY25_15610, partial [Bacteroidetes bacterium]|nr:hypothetical protein [Bacteroidota bacterium]
MHTLLRTSLWLSLSILLTGFAYGQTPTTTIQNSNSETRLRLNYDGGLLVPGAFGPTTPADSIPATGAGARLMWYPAKAAFRAGRVFDNTAIGFGVDGRTFWDPANVGNYSVAFGNNTTASGEVSFAAGINTVASSTKSTAFGAGTEASGEAATALGNETTASAANATAMGAKTTASGIESTALGAETVASEAQATAMGDGTTASGPNATAMGDGTTASGPNATAMGGGTTASGGSATAMGFDTEASGDFTTAMGRSTTASKRGATAMGRFPTASGDAATAMGFSTNASSANATAMGDRTTANGISATAMGSGTTASSFAATAMGFNTTAATEKSLAIGEYNSANTSADGTLLVAGNGASGSRSDAFVLKQDGDLVISGTLTESSDRRLKTSIRPLKGETLAKLSRLRPVRYEFKNQKTHPAGEQIGLIAQDVREEFPALVRGGEGDALSL